MSVSVKMPQLGESVTEGTVTRWLKKEGDQIATDEPLLEVSTDKVDTEIPSPSSGVLLRILAHEDEVVAVGAELAVIGDANEAPLNPPTAASTTTPNPRHPPRRKPRLTRQRRTRPRRRPLPHRIHPAPAPHPPHRKGKSPQWWYSPLSARV